MEDEVLNNQVQLPRLIMAISFVKSFSLKSTPGRVGYVNKVSEPDSVSDTEDDDGSNLVTQAADKDVSFNAYHVKSSCSSLKPEHGTAFAMLIPAMWPQDILAALAQPEDGQPPCAFDSFGFIIEKDGGQVTARILISPEETEEEDRYGPGDAEDNGLDNEQTRELEDKLRTKWISYLEFNYNESAQARMKWSQVEPVMRRTIVLDGLVRSGLPHSMRSHLWPRFSQAHTLRTKSKWTYTEMCDQSNYVDHLSDEQVCRILPSNGCYMNHTAVGIEKLRRLLRVVKWIQRSGSIPVATTQESVNIATIAAYLLLICTEEDSFWLVMSIVSELKALDHQAMLRSLIGQHCPDADAVIKSNDIEISLISLNWFSSLFANYIPETALLYRFWDFYFYYGPVVLFQLAVGLIIEKSNLLTSVGMDSAAIFNILSDLPCHVTSTKKLLHYWSSGKELVAQVHTSGRNGPSMASASKSVSRSTSMLTLPSIYKTESPEKQEIELRTKNVRQTSMMVDLHDAIAAIGKHFEAYDTTFKVSLVPDFGDLGEDYDSYYSMKPRKVYRRAKALIDFQRHDPDELGFRRNDIITVVSERDEHCWVGELNGLRGWFPAKFVELLDERNGDYHLAGDDRIVPFINDLVRGRFCNALKNILTYGLKRTLFVAMHPWNIIEAVATACIEGDFNSVYSRLVLTKTFRLDEFARVLTPSEMLYRSIAHVNQTHENEPMDLKLRSLVTIGLNQQILHDWFTVIVVMQPEIVAKYYYTWSYMTSPAWRLIRSELKLLTQFTFNLNPNAELQQTNVQMSPVSKDGVTDMLVKHHLFSWDI
ncbi:Small G protein signaling modulator 3 -like protein [Halotydeus destructor]|nr:Small G protein signaling modulator 3 -like protein [Halotydeus destructor]